MSVPEWRLLTSSLKVRGSPTLLIKHETATQHSGKVSRLKVCVTDLTYLWMEVLERKELVRKACDTSIDPIEQFDTLLEYLNKGLNFAPRTSLVLKSEKGRSHLVLHLKSPLPEPLRPLEWDFDLKQASELEFTREFVIPLMGNLFERQNALLDMETIIINKDKAIERVDTGLKTQNKQITGLFDPRFFGEGVAEKHKKGILMNKIPGFRPYNPEQSQMMRNEKPLPNVKDLNKHLFGEGLGCKTSNLSFSHEAWWENLGGGIEVEEPSQISQPTMLRKETTSGFERAMNGNHHDGRQYGGLGGSTSVAKDRPVQIVTDEGNDSDATASTMSDLESSAPRPTRRIGKIGGHKVLPNSGEKLRDRSSPVLESRPYETRSPSEEASHATTSRVIGKIRGAPISHEQSREPPTDLIQADQLPSRTTVATRDPQAAGSSPIHGDMLDNPDEIANRNRALLKHDLEEKRKAPVKKKRKF